MSGFRVYCAGFPSVVSRLHPSRRTHLRRDPSKSRQSNNKLLSYILGRSGMLCEPWHGQGREWNQKAIHFSLGRMQLPDSGNRTNGIRPNELTGKNKSALWARHDTFRLILRPSRGHTRSHFPVTSFYHFYPVGGCWPIPSTITFANR